MSGEHDTSVLKARFDLDKCVTEIILVIFPATLQLADNLYLSPLSLKLMLCFRLARRLRVIVVAGVGVGVVGAAYIRIEYLDINLSARSQSKPLVLAWDSSSLESD